MSENPVIATKDSVLNAVAALMHRGFEVQCERDRRFDWPEGSVVADLYLPPPLHCIVQFDDAPHCTRERAATFASYATDIPLNFNVRRYQKDQTPGDPTIAKADVLADLLPPKHDLNPTVRIRADEVADVQGTLEERIATLLSRRFAYHSGTVFQNMLANAGGKPHHTYGE